MRIEFTAAVKRAIAERVNYHCSNPICRVGTTGPHSDSGRSIMLGVAAHITAAAPGGPRYDEALSDTDRGMALNGIWLCQNCAKLVDNDERRYTTVLLKRWKTLAEVLASDNAGKSALFSRESAPQINFLTVPHHGGVTYSPDESNRFDARRLFAVPPARDANVEILARGTNSLRVPFVVVGVADSRGWDWEITYFVASEFGWNPQVTVKLAGQKGHTPRVDYLPGLPGGLLLQHVAGTGTGVFRTESSLYRVGGEDAEPVLHFPTYLHVVGWGMPFDRHLELLSLSRPVGLVQGAMLSLTYRLRYEIGAQESPLAHTFPLLTYDLSFNLVWDEQSQQFVPVGPQDDFSLLDTIWNEGADGFVTRCRDDLLKLKASGTDEQRRFVERYIR